MQFIHITSMQDDFKLSLGEWIFILSVSSRYDMDKIRQRAIRQIISHHPRIDPIEKIMLAEKHNIPDWLPSAYASLCQRANPLEEWEAEKLGMGVMVKLARAREAVRELSTRPRSSAFNSWGSVAVVEAEPQCTDHELYDAREVRRVVDEVFWPRPPQQTCECLQTVDRLIIANILLSMISSAIVFHGG
jgi:hypothetical protein